MTGRMREERGRLLARPRPVAATGVSAGTSRLPGGALLHVPPITSAAKPLPLVVLFHGAGSTAPAGLALLAEIADRAGLVLLAPQSLAASWDVIHGGFGPDVEALDDVLATVFASCPVDPARVALGGFSDGASYALSLGVANGDLVTHIVAFSPGFIASATPRGRPRIFIAHGIRDAVLPIDRCGRRLVAQLRRAGYDLA